MPSFLHSSNVLMYQNSSTTIPTTPLPAAPFPFPTASGRLMYYIIIISAIDDIIKKEINNATTGNLNMSTAVACLGVHTLKNPVRDFKFQSI